MIKVYLQYYYLVYSKIYNEQVNMQILNAPMDYIIGSDRFTGSLI